MNIDQVCLSDEVICSDRKLAGLTITLEATSPANIIRRFLDRSVFRAAW